MQGNNLSTPVDVETASARLSEVLEKIGFDPEAAARVVEVALDEVDRDETSDRPGLTRSRRVLAVMLEAQGVDPQTSALLAPLLPSLDLTRITANPRHARALLDVNATSFQEYRDAGRVRPWAWHRRNGWPTDTLYNLAELVYAAAWRARHPYQYGEKRRWWPRRP